jgi:uncharacterized protein YxjI
MPLLRRRGGAPGRRFQMREKLISIGDDAWIEDERGDRAYKVDGKALRIRDTFVLEDRGGNEVATIRERKLSVRETYGVEIREGEDEGLLLALTVAIDSLTTRT